MTKFKCGFIGLGSQGAPMARRMIEAGYPTALWARRPEALDPFEDTSAAFAPDIAALGAEVEHIGICVVDDDGVREVCAELLPVMKPGSRIVIHSTISPRTCAGLAMDAKERGLFVIDAPVSGGGVGAAAGTLTVMVGGEDEAVSLARPVFETFGKTILHLGGVGAGQHAKLINNTLMATHFAVAHHAMTIADQLGMNRQTLAELINVSSGRSFGFETYARQAKPSAFVHGAKLLQKDLHLLGDATGAVPSSRALTDITDPVLTMVLAGKDKL